jgi:hypothetical protein
MLYDKLNEAWDNQDTDAFMALHHEDYQFTFHSDGRVMKKNDWDMGQLKSFMQNIKMEHGRCVYENEDILVRHNIVTFASGDKEAVMTVTLKKDGLFWRQETGATPLSTG